MNKLIVFLDSNEYKRCGHNFKSTPMKKLVELTQKGIIKIISTNVVVSEVSQHIEDDVDTFASEQKKLAHDAGAIRNIPEMAVFVNKIDIEEIKRKAKQAFQDFLHDTECEVLTSKEIDADALLDDYFNKRLPFERNVRKGDEFKDAFIVYTLRKYSIDFEQCVHVVSSDKGFCGALEGNDKFRVYQRSEELFTYITMVAEEIPQANVISVHDYINDNQDLIDELIADAINGTSIYVDEEYNEGNIVSAEISFKKTNQL